MDISRPLPYYKWYVTDYRANRQLQRMGYIARGFHRELLDEQWLEGSLPGDIKSLAEICQCPPKAMERAWPELEPIFEKDENGRLVNHSLEELRTSADSLRIKRIKAGRLGGLAKHEEASAKQMHGTCQQVLADAKHMPYRREEESREDNISPPTADAVEDVCESLAPTKKPVARFSSEDIENIYQAYPRHLGKGEALKAIKKALESIDDPTPVESLLAIVREYAESPAGQLGQYTPYPASWFNAKSYLDDPKEWEKTGVQR